MSVRKTATKPVVKIEEFFNFSDAYDGEDALFTSSNARECARSRVEDIDSDYHLEDISITKITYDPIKGLVATELEIGKGGVKFSDEK